MSSALKNARMPEARDDEPAIRQIGIEPVAYRHWRRRTCAGVGLRADFGGAGGEITGGDPSRIAAPAVDQQLDTAAVSCTDFARTFRLAVEARDHLAQVGHASQFLTHTEER